MRVASALLLSFALTACGFRLQGVPTLPPMFARTAISAPADQALIKRELAEKIEVSGGRVVADAVGATAEVRILQADSQQRVLSVSAQGRPLEYQVTYEVRFDVTVDGATVLAPQRIELRRDYPFDDSDVLARQREAGVLLAAMQRDMARLIHLRLAALRPKP